MRVEQNCLLLETGGKRVLFDNGMGSSKLFGPDSGQLLGSLAEAGVDPASIDALVLTHAHSDHCWGTMRDDGVPNYPNATIYMAEAELAYLGIEPPGERRERSLAGVRKHLLPLRDRIRLIRDGEEFLPGVHAWLTPGHTPGHMAYLFDGGWCLTGDVAFHDPLSYVFPEAESAFDTDPAEGIATRQRVLARLARREAGDYRLSQSVAGSWARGTCRRQLPVPRRQCDPRRHGAVNQLTAVCDARIHHGATL